MRRWGQSLAVIGLLLAPAAVRAAEDQPPHGLGLLAGGAVDEAALAKLGAGLGSPRPEVRAAAVRVINVSGMGALVPAVAAALAVENDPQAAFEMVRFLASLRHPQGDADAIAATRRLGEPLDLALIDGLGRRGAAASTHIATLRSLGLSDFRWRMFYRLAVGSATGGVGPLSAALLREADPKGWRIFLQSLREAGVDLDLGQAVAALRSPDADVRAATCWHVAIAFPPERLADPTLASALDEAPESQAASVTPAAFAFEALDRRRGRAAHPLAASVKTLGPSLRDTMPWDALDADGLLKVFDKEERKALGVSFFDDEKALDEKRVRPMRRRLRDGGVAVIETPRGLPAGYVTDVLRAAGCDPKGWGGMLSGEVTYGPDGRPRGVGVVRKDAPAACLEAARALLTAALAPLGVPSPTGQKALLLLPDHPEFLKCLDEASNVPPRRLDEEGGKASGNFREPRKIRDVEMRYPPAAKAAGVQGLVIVEATIASSGCVQGLSLLRGLRTDMDLEAIRSVSGWVYEPARVDGTPVPVLLTVAVNFKLDGPVFLEPIR